MKDMLVTAAVLLILCMGISFSFTALKVGNKSNEFLINTQKDRASINYQSAYDEEQVSTKAEVIMDIMASDIPVEIDGITVPIVKNKNGNINNISQIKSMVTKTEYYKYFEYDSNGNQTKLVFVKR